MNRPELRTLPYAMRFGADVDLRRVAAVICDRAWRGVGVRVYRWPDGALVLVGTDSRSDQLLIRHAADALVGTFCRVGALSDGPVGPGPQQADVLDQLRWTAASAPSPRGNVKGDREVAGEGARATPQSAEGDEPGGGSFGEAHMRVARPQFLGS